MQTQPRSVHLTLGRIAMLLRFAALVSFSSLVALLVACADTSEFRVLPDDHTPPADPAVQARIAAYEAAPTDKRFSNMRRVLYGGMPAYLITSACCDQFNYLYDAQGLRLCAPSGGIAGNGDGKCNRVVSYEGPAPARQPPAAVVSQ